MVKNKDKFPSQKVINREMNRRLFWRLADDPPENYKEDWGRVKDSLDMQIMFLHIILYEPHWTIKKKYTELGMCMLIRKYIKFIDKYGMDVFKVAFTDWLRCRKAGFLSPELKDKVVIEAYCIGAKHMRKQGKKFKLWYRLEDINVDKSEGCLDAMQQNEESDGVALQHTEEGEEEPDEEQ